MNLMQIDVIAIEPTGRGLLVFAISVLLPLLVGLVTKRFASGGLKATVLLFLSAVTGFLTELLSAMDAALSFNVTQAVLQWGVSFGLAVLAHFGFWKPTGIASGVQIATRNFGVGTSENKHAEERGHM